MTSLAVRFEPEQRSRRQMFKLFLAEKRDPVPFYEALAEQTVAGFPFELAGMRLLDLGCGPGHFSRALTAAGATVLSVDFDAVELKSGPTGAVAADARRLPLGDGAVDGVFCSNMLEHAPETPAVFNEIARVLKRGGWAWVSWTNWYSPWGGHEITPFHYLGPRLGLAAYRSMKGEPRKNVPGEGLFPVHIGPTLALLRRQQRLRLMDAYPRYYPSQRWIVRVPGVREVFTWNCVLLLERVADAA
jgi:SAM-dependent methyltransferase